MIGKYIGRLLGFQKEIDRLNLKIQELSWDEPFGMLTRGAFIQVCRIMPRGNRVVVFIDLDDVHGLNDKYGYLTVDEKVKSAFSIPLRSSDIVSRWYSGDEIVILFDTDWAGAERKVEELQENSLRSGITFQYAMGIWDVGRESIVDVVDELSNIALHKKKTHRVNEGPVAGRQR